MVQKPMFFIAWMTIGMALAGPSLDADKVCAAESPVAMSLGLYRQLGRRPGPACSSLIPSQTISDYMKAFAVVGRELFRPEVADQLARQVGARWLILEDRGGFTTYDTEANDFVDAALFTTGETSTPAKPSEIAYQTAFRALRAKRHDQAREKLQECLGLDPEHVGCHWEMGWVHWVDEDWPAVVNSWKEVQRLEPEYPELERWLSEATAKAGQNADPPPVPIAVSDLPPTHCVAPEVVGFSCIIEDQALSLCWANDSRKALQFRLGPVGQPQLTWPTDATAEFDTHFVFVQDTLAAPPGGQVRPRLQTNSLTFSLDGNRYTVFEELHDFDVHQQGVRVTVAGLSEVALMCNEASASQLANLPP